MQNLPKPVREHGFEADFAYGPPSAFLATNYRPQVGRLYVDRFGREREETFILDGSERQMVSVDIWDVVAEKSYALSPTDKKVLWEDPIHPQECRIWDISLPGIMGIALPRHSLSGKEKIGTEQIEGLTCKGAVMESVGTSQYPGFVIESWYAEEIASLFS